MSASQFRRWLKEIHPEVHLYEFQERIVDSILDSSAPAHQTIVYGGRQQGIKFVTGYIEEYNRSMHYMKAALDVLAKDAHIRGDPR